jgi:phospholipid/cholesterol/gamma-HCH transport system ATP-binding protein
MLRLVDVHKKLGKQHVLRGVSLEIHEGENMVIIGRSGGGKSVLLRHIMGLWHPDSGEVWFNGDQISAMQEEEIVPLRKKMGMLFQNGAFSLREEGRLGEDEIQKEVAQALKVVDLPGQEGKMPSELSGGMRKRVALARAAIARPRLMMYDEPTSGLDPVISDSINKLIVRLGEQLEMTAIIVTHDMVSAYEIADRIALLHEGKIYCVDTPEKIQESKDPVVERFVKGISSESDAII